MKIKTTLAVLLIIVLATSCETEDPIQTTPTSNAVDSYIPTVPFLLDGKPGIPEDLNRYINQPLFYAAIGGETLNIFTTSELEKEYTKSMLKSIPLSNAKVNEQGFTLLFENRDNIGGAQWQYNYPEWDIPDFRFAPWYGNINDRVSALFSVHSSYYQGVLLYEHAKYKGAYLRIINQAVNDLHYYGWGDRISSMRIAVPDL